MSRTFAEMLGLDTGWNCYISLSDDSNSFNKENVKDLVENTRTTIRNTKLKKLQEFSPNSLYSNESNVKLLKNVSFYQSLPSLKILKGKSYANTYTHNVKFNLKNLHNLDEKIYEEGLLNDDLINQSEEIEPLVLIQKSSSKKFNSATNSTSKANQDEDILSHRTDFSERTLSETDVLDNAVNIRYVFR